MQTNMLRTMWNIKWILVFVNTFLLICFKGKLHCSVFLSGFESAGLKPRGWNWKEHIDRLFASVNIGRFPSLLRLHLVYWDVENAFLAYYWISIRIRWGFNHSPCCINGEEATSTEKLSRASMCIYLGRFFPFFGYCYESLKIRFC